MHPFYRGKAISVAVVANFASNLLVTLAFPTMLDVIGSSWTFAIFAFIDAYSLYFIKTRVGACFVCAPSLADLLVAVCVFGSPPPGCSLNRRGFLFVLRTLVPLLLSPFSQSLAFVSEWVDSVPEPLNAHTEIFLHG